MQHKPIMAGWEQQLDFCWQHESGMQIDIGHVLRLNLEGSRVDE